MTSESETQASVMAKTQKEALRIWTKVEGTDMIKMSADIASMYLSASQEDFVSWISKNPLHEKIPLHRNRNGHDIGDEDLNGVDDNDGADASQPVKDLPECITDQLQKEDVKQKGKENILSEDVEEQPRKYTGSKDVETTSKVCESEKNVNQTLCKPNKRKNTNGKTEKEITKHAKRQLSCEKISSIRDSEKTIQGKINEQKSSNEVPKETRSKPKAEINLKLDDEMQQIHEDNITAPRTKDDRTPSDGPDDDGMEIKSRANNVLSIVRSSPVPKPKSPISVISDLDITSIGSLLDEHFSSESANTSNPKGAALWRFLRWNMKKAEEACEGTPTPGKFQESPFDALIDLSSDELTRESISLTCKDNSKRSTLTNAARVFNRIFSLPIDPCETSTYLV